VSEDDVIDRSPRTQAERIRRIVRYVHGCGMPRDIRDAAETVWHRFDVKALDVVLTYLWCDPYTPTRITVDVMMLDGTIEQLDEDDMRRAIATIAA
jgi:hypothetical protein